MDAEKDAQDQGYEVSHSEDDAIDAAISALSRLQQFSEFVPEVENEVLVHEWDEELGEEIDVDDF